MNIIKHLMCASLFSIVNNVISSSSSSDDINFKKWQEKSQIQQQMWDNYNYEVSMEAQEINDSKKLIDFLGESYSEERKKTLEISIAEALKDQYNKDKNQKINKTLPNPRKRKARINPCVQTKQKVTSSSSSID